MKIEQLLLYTFVIFSFIKSQKECLFPENGQIDKCLICHHNFYIQTIEKSQSIQTLGKCIQRNDQTTEIIFYVSMTKCTTKCNGSYQKPFQTLGAALREAAQNSLPYKNTILTIFLMKGQHIIDQSDFLAQSSQYWLFRYQLANITIKPLFCDKVQNEISQEDCFENNNQRALIIVYTNNFYIFVSGQLTLQNLEFDLWNASFILNKDTNNWCQKENQQCCLGNPQQNNICWNYAINSNNSRGLFGLINIEKIISAKLEEQINPILLIENVTFKNFIFFQDINVWFSLISKNKAGGIITLDNVTLNNYVLRQGIININQFDDFSGLVNKQMVQKNEFASLVINNFNVSHFLPLKLKFQKTIQETKVRLFLTTRIVRVEVYPTISQVQINGSLQTLRLTNIHYNNVDGDINLLLNFLTFRSQFLNKQSEQIFFSNITFKNISQHTGVFIFLNQIQQDYILQFSNLVIDKISTNKFLEINSTKSISINQLNMQNVRINDNFIVSDQKNIVEFNLTNVLMDNVVLNVKISQELSRLIYQQNQFITGFTTFARVNIFNITMNNTENICFIVNKVLRLPIPSQNKRLLQTLPIQVHQDQFISQNNRFRLLQMTTSNDLQVDSKPTQEELQSKYYLTFIQIENITLYSTVNTYFTLYSHKLYISNLQAYNCSGNTTIFQIQNHITYTDAEVYIKNINISNYAISYAVEQPLRFISFEAKSQDISLTMQNINIENVTFLINQTTQISIEERSIIKISQYKDIFLINSTFIEIPHYKLISSKSNHYLSGILGKNLVISNVLFKAINVEKNLKIQKVKHIDYFYDDITRQIYYTIHRFHLFEISQVQNMLVTNLSVFMNPQNKLLSIFEINNSSGQILNSQFHGIYSEYQVFNITGQGLIQLDRINLSNIFGNTANVLAVYYDASVQITNIEFKLEKENTYFKSLAFSQTTWKMENVTFNTELNMNLQIEQIFDFGEKTTLIMINVSFNDIYLKQKYIMNLRSSIAQLKNIKINFTQTQQYSKPKLFIRAKDSIINLENCTFLGCMNYNETVSESCVSFHNTQYQLNHIYFSDIQLKHGAQLLNMIFTHINEDIKNKNSINISNLYFQNIRSDQFLIYLSSSDQTIQLYLNHFQFKNISTYHNGLIDLESSKFQISNFSISNSVITRGPIFQINTKQTSSQFILEQSYVQNCQIFTVINTYKTHLTIKDSQFQQIILTGMENLINIDQGGLEIQNATFVKISKQYLDINLYVFFIKLSQTIFSLFECIDSITCIGLISESTISVNQSKFVNNTGDYGPALNAHNSKVEIYNTLIQSNRAINGGGICTFKSSVKLVNAQLINNYASDIGSQIYMVSNNNEYTKLELDLVYIFGATNVAISLVEISSIIIQNTFAEKCNQTTTSSKQNQIISIKDSNNVNLSNSTFQNIYQQGALLIVQNSKMANVTVTKLNCSNITKNTSGACLELQGQINIIIENSTFIQNKALNEIKGYGGAIYALCNYECKDLIIKNCEFINNTAKLGGKSIQIKNYFPKSSSSYLDKNISKNNYYPDDETDIVNSDPHDIIITDLNYSSEVKSNIQKNKKIQIFSGEKIHITAKIIDYFQNQITNSPSRQDFMVKLLFYKVQNLTYGYDLNLTKNLTSNYTSKIQSDHVTFKDIIIQDYQGSNIIGVLQLNDFDNVSTKFYITIGLCPIGYFVDNQTCFICPDDTYSLKQFQNDPKYGSSQKNQTQNIGQICQKCPLNSVCREGNKIEPKHGYWRSNENSSLIQRCPVSDACNYSNITHEKCTQNYFGPLCTLCKEDKGYYSDGKCYDCKGHIKQLFINIGITLCMIGWATYSTLKLDFTSNTSGYLKILINYTGFITIINTFVSSWQSQIAKFYDFQNQVNTMPKDAASFDCLLKDYINDSSLRYLVGLIITELLPVIMLIIMTILYFLIKLLQLILCSSKVNKQSTEETNNQNSNIATTEESLQSNITNENLKEMLTEEFNFVHFLISGFLIAGMNLYPIVIQDALKPWNCVQIDSTSPQKFNLYLANISCWTDFHMQYLIPVTIPFLIFWCIVLPGVYLYYFKRLQSKMTQRKITQEELQTHILIHGRDRILYHIVSDYKNDCIHHEAYNYFIKLGLLVVREFTMSLDPATQGAVLITLIFSIYLKTEFIQPYRFQVYNQLEALSFMIAIISIAIGIITADVSYSANILILFYIILIVSNLFFFFEFARHMRVAVFNDYIAGIEWLSSKQFIRIIFGATVSNQDTKDKTD